MSTQTGCRVPLAVLTLLFLLGYTMMMICRFMGFDFEGMIRVSYAEAAGNSVTFPSVNNASPLGTMSFKTSGVIQATPAGRICWKQQTSLALIFYSGYAVRRCFFKINVAKAWEGFFSLVICHLGPFVTCENQVAELWKLVLSLV